MHVISRDRALAHWKALNGLSTDAFRLLETRFLKEQSLLAFTALPEDVTSAGPDQALAILERPDDPRLAGFRQFASRAAIAVEIFRREAGRPLRALTEDEVGALFEESLMVFDRAAGKDRDSIRGDSNIFTSVAQRHLFSGVSAAVLGDRSLSMDECLRLLLLLRVAVEGFHRACGEAPATVPPVWDVERICIALSAQGDPLRREALATAENFREELVPAFIDELKFWVAEPEIAVQEPGTLGFHAIHLLAAWRESSAWPLLRDLFSLTETDPHDLLGDLITEDGSIVLAMVVGDRLEELRALIEDERLDDFVRGAGIDALTCLVAWGELPRAAHIEYLRELLTMRLRTVPENRHAFACVVSAVCDLEAWELRPEVEAACARGAVDETIVSLSFVAEAQEGRCGSLWATFCDRHQPLNNVADATGYLDKLPEIATSSDPEERDGPALNQPGLPYHAPPKVGRNDPCPCGSGRKFKKCCGKQ